MKIFLSSCPHRHRVDGGNFFYRIDLTTHNILRQIEIQQSVNEGMSSKVCLSLLRQPNNLKNGGFSYLHEIINKPILKIMTFLAPNHSKKNKLLTARQVEILAWVAIGATDIKIAEKLGMSTSTVKGHLNKIFKKINVPNRRQAILWALKNL